MEIPKKRAYRKSGKKREFSARPGQVVQLAGKRFGLLTVLQRAGRKRKFIAWLCRCDCGVELVVGGDKLRRGLKFRCSASKHPTPRAPGITTEYKSEYQSWENMHERCVNPKHRSYLNYGARGIKVCEHWAEFKNFMLDMGRKPDPKFTIEREDVNGNYEPKNCRWISRKDQGRNKRNSVSVTYQGRRLLLIDLVEELGLTRNVVYQRLKLGWTLAQAIALPKGSAINRGRPRGSYKKNKIKIPLDTP